MAKINKDTLMRFSLCLFILLLLLIPFSKNYAQKSHPHILVNSQDKIEILNKIDKDLWAKKVFEDMIGEVSPYVERHKIDPEWILSRYLMNRIPGKRYIEFYSDENGTALVNYGGDAPYPTVRVSPHKRPPITKDGYSYRMPKIEELVPYDTSMLMNLQSNAPDRAWAKVFPQSFVGKLNGEMNKLALNASIIYWLTGKEEYAYFAADLLTQWARGASYQNPIIGPGRTGYLDIQTLGDGNYEALILTYDFLYDFLRQKAYETNYYETVFEKIAHTMTFRGYWNNNWFAAQTPAMVFAALSLEDEKARDTYLDYYLTKDTINGGYGHLALPSVVGKWLTPDGHWKEPGGYHNYPVSSLLLSALAMEKNGYPVYKKFPALFDASYVMLKYSFPNLTASSYGDTGVPRQSPACLEMGIVMAEKYKFGVMDQLIASMNVLIDNKQYSREQSGYLGLLCFLPELPNKPDVSYIWPKSGTLDFAKLYLQRNGMDRDYGLMYVVQGASYNHNHANGMSMELYGAGNVMGIDPGKGLTYEAPMHVNYYAQWAAHNTVVAGARSSSDPYFRGGGGTKKMGQIELAAMEPRAEKEAMSEFCSFTDTRYLDISTNTKQQRTMAIIRTSDTSGYYVDIYRSAHPESNEYLYHNIGNDLKFFTPDRKLINTSPASFPLCKEPFDPPGFRNILDFQSPVSNENGLIALFSLKEDANNESFMQVLLPTEKERTYYSGSAPASPTAPPAYRDMPTPVLISRQKGEAWKRPFIAVYDPYIGHSNFNVEKIELIDNSKDGQFTVLKVFNRNQSEQLIFQSLDNTKNLSKGQNMDWSFTGNFGVVGLKNNEFAYLYIGEGSELSYKDYSLKTSGPESSANFEIEGDHFKINCTNITTVSIAGSKMKKVILTNGTISRELEVSKKGNGIQFVVPPVINGTLLMN
jgi:hypothetical protein